MDLIKRYGFEVRIEGMMVNERNKRWGKSDGGFWNIKRKEKKKGEKWDYGREDRGWDLNDRSR